MFEETAWENLAHADREFWASVNRVSRVVLCVLLFLLILSASSATTFSFLIIAYNMGAAADNFNLSSSQVLQEAGSVVRVRWVWAAIIVTTAPYFFTLCSSVVKLCVKRTRRVTLKPLLTVRTGWWYVWDVIVDVSLVVVADVVVVVIVVVPYLFILCSSVVKLCVKRTRRVTLKPLLTVRTGRWYVWDVIVGVSLVVVADVVVVVIVAVLVVPCSYCAAVWSNVRQEDTWSHLETSADGED